MLFPMQDTGEVAVARAGEPRCGVCRLSRGCQQKLGVVGKGRRKVLFVSGAPSKAEDKTGEPFSGASGGEIRDMVKEAGLDPDRDCYWTNALACAPGSSSLTVKHVDYCRPRMMAILEDYRPNVVIPLGGEAVRSILQPLWRDNMGFMDQWVGWKIPHRDWNCWVCPAWGSKDFRDAKTNQVRSVLQTRYIRRALKIRDTPWGEEGAPDYRQKVQVIIDTREAAQMIRQMIRKGGFVAYDYETTTLKPQGRHAQIVSCSVCWNGEITIAFPWDGVSRQAVRELLQSDLGKIAANGKFEESWGWNEFQEPMRNFVWDTMQSGHVHRVTKRTAGLKFQALVLLGLPAYDNHIKAFLKSKRPNLPNRIRQIPIRELLLYNGLDSLVEFEIAEIQAKPYGRSFRV